MIFLEKGMTNSVYLSLYDMMSGTISSSQSVQIDFIDGVYTTSMTYSSIDNNTRYTELEIFVDDDVFTVDSYVYNIYQIHSTGSNTYLESGQVSFTDTYRDTNTKVIVESTTASTNIIYKKDDETEYVYKRKRN